MSWDHQLTWDEFSDILKQVDVLQKAEKYCVIFWHKPDDTHIIRDVLEKRSYKELTHFYWHKTGHYTPTPTFTYTSSMEMCTIAYTPNRKECPQNLPLDPRKRHNFVDMPAVSVYMKHDDGTVINECQKPVELAKLLISNHISPGGNVLVLGTGAGGEVMGAVAAQCNVVGVEKDPKQFKGLVANLIKQRNVEIAAEEKKVLKENEEDQEESDSQQTESSANNQPSLSEESGEVETKQICKECAGEIKDPDYDYTCANCPGHPVFHPNCVDTSPECDTEVWCNTCLNDYSVDERTLSVLGFGAQNEEEMTY